ncbi:hypothetical protein N9362_00270 [bacterium]|nr:hypothetical protein [bacterium]
MGILQRLSKLKFCRSTLRDNGWKEIFPHQSVLKESAVPPPKFAVRALTALTKRGMHRNLPYGGCMVAAMAARDRGALRTINEWRKAKEAGNDALAETLAEAPAVVTDGDDNCNGHGPNRPTRPVPGHLDVASALEIAASVHGATGAERTAGQLRARALAIKQAAYGDHHERAARILHSARCKSAFVRAGREGAGDAGAAARSHCERALSIFERGNDGPSFAELFAMLAQLSAALRVLGDAGAARALCKLRATWVLVRWSRRHLGRRGAKKARAERRPHAPTPAARAGKARRAVCHGKAARNPLRMLPNGSSKTVPTKPRIKARAKQPAGGEQL